MKQVVLNIPDKSYDAFINHIKSKFADIVIKEKKSAITEEVAEEDSIYMTMLLSEKSLAKDWMLPEEDEAWKDL
jgi:hypothetical protein